VRATSEEREAAEVLADLHHLRAVAALVLVEHVHRAASEQVEPVRWLALGEEGVAVRRAFVHQARGNAREGRCRQAGKEAEPRLVAHQLRRLRGDLLGCDGRVVGAFGAQLRQGLRAPGVEKTARAS
jgi:hypothetical protein